MKLSIIICTYNRSRLLKKCLDSLEEQTEPNGYEVIVVDNNSTDGTYELTTLYRLLRMRYTKETHLGLSYARNAGAKIAFGNYLCYIDDDCLLPVGYAANVLRVLEEQRPDIMGGPIYPWYDSPKPKWFRNEYEIRKYEKQSGYSLTCPISGGNYIIRKELLVKLGMFDINLGMKGNKIGIGEERKVLEQYRSLTPIVEQKVYYSLECSLLHYVPAYKMKYSYVIKRSYTAGRASLTVINSKSGDSHATKETNILKRVVGVILTIFMVLKRDGFTIHNICKVVSRYAGIIVETLRGKYGRRIS